MMAVEGNGLDVSLIVHIFDVAHDLGIAPMEKLLEPDIVAARASAIFPAVSIRSPWRMNAIRAASSASESCGSDATHFSAERVASSSHFAASVEFLELW